jgi:hypothetical protein
MYLENSLDMFQVSPTRLFFCAEERQQFPPKWWSPYTYPHGVASHHHENPESYNFLKQCHKEHTRMSKRV